MQCHRSRLLAMLLKVMHWIYVLERSSIYPSFPSHLPSSPQSIPTDQHWTHSCPPLITIMDFQGESKMPKADSPPPLTYSLHTRIRSIAIVWTLLLTITCLQIEVLYFALHYGGNLDYDVALGAPTGILLGVSILTILYRTWLLMRRGSTCRPLGGKWWQVSINFS